MQVAITTATSSATTRLYNEDRIATIGLGLANSSVTMSGNSTVGEASANRAVNSVTLNTGTTQTASAGIANDQQSTAAVNANATTFANVTLAGGDALAPAAALANGGVTIAGNSTRALARGNTATNVLNVAADSDYGTSAGIGWQCPPASRKCPASP
ncbi:MAG: hypothetical protein WCZ66_03260 [Sphingomonadaceae bacterium]